MIGMNSYCDEFDQTLLYYHVQHKSARPWPAVPCAHVLHHFIDEWHKLDNILQEQTGFPC